MNSAVHEPTDACKEDHCYSHHVDEPGPFWRLCGECFHGFPTRRALEQDYVEVMRAANVPIMGSTIDADLIHFCPHCTHDF